MDINLLIDGIVRQTTVLIAQLATLSGNRTPLAHTANQVFLSLVKELKRQGLGNKVIADMFGLALRTYHDKVQRLSESQTFRGRSLWEAVLQFVQEQNTVTRPEVLQRFRNDDDRVVRGVLTDLVDSGLISRSGTGDSTVFQSAPPLADANSPGAHLEATACLVWVTVHRFGPLSKAALSNRIQIDAPLLDAALQLLLDSARVNSRNDTVETLYEAPNCVIPMGTAAGWEAAVFDHYQAVVTAICAKLGSGVRRAESGELIGGSTYTFDVWSGHPLEAEVAGHLQRLRRESVELRLKLEAYNAAHTAPGSAVRKKFISYVGQTVVEHNSEEE